MVIFEIKMKINPGFGLENILFGMKQSDVEAIYGKPSRRYKDDENNEIYLYNQEKLRLTFYEDENYRLGYILTSNPDSVLLGHKVIGSQIAMAIEKFRDHGLKDWERENIDLSTNHFNEEKWIILEEEFGVIVKVEIGAIIKDDAFEWKYGK